MSDGEQQPLSDGLAGVLRPPSAAAEPPLAPTGQPSADAAPRPALGAQQGAAAPPQLARGGAAALVAEEPALRLRLARLAESLVAASGEAHATAGTFGAWRTRAAGESVDGVQVLPGADGCYEVELHLVLRWPPQPLHEFAENLREGLAVAAAAIGLRERLGPIQVHFDGLEEPLEPPAEELS
ncbi:MAG: hypothetical protein ACYCU0_12450 [Solirubrobacteraceae bacterium]